MPSSRRKFIAAAGASGMIGVAGCTGGDEVDEVVLGTITPLSGPFALNGTLTKQGVDFAVEEINENGGIEALDGAEMTVVSEDTGETTDSATSAAQDLYSNHAPSAAFGSWLSSQTLATTSVSERQGVPQLTLSYSDEIVERGYEYTFQLAPKSSELGEQSLDLSVQLAEAVDSEIEKVAIVGDNTAAITFTFDPLRDEIIPNRDGIEIVVDEVWSPTLTDATPIVRQLQEQEPDVMIFGATAFPDSVAILRKMNELDVQLPMIGIGAWLALPAYIENVGADLAEGIMAATGAHPLAGQEENVRRFTEFSDEPFMIQDSLISYAGVYVVKEAIEQSGSTDPGDVRDAISDIELTEGNAVDSFPIDTIQFEDNGHMEGAQPVLAQWKDREDADWVGTEAAPFTVFPEEVAMREVEWTPPEY
ncbi:ABC transporter substrate-binding protein [Natronosalvus halobius]|uniref:ABC transporter substrate-binding protein n=1 Tax=Natronosalvus halobius TaxID=2953746 RepID=UPI0020A1271C|nr:ABC transporter substrate-binding protein [Natronosalvus halobius]USZ73584.1 ABC transporter substrate-binding protein [Natronosalvus halobius]